MAAILVLFGLEIAENQLRITFYDESGRLTGGPFAVTKHLSPPAR